MHLNHSKTFPPVHGKIVFCKISSLCLKGTAAAAKSLQLCDPIEGSPLGSSVPGILQARILEWY